MWRPNTGIPPGKTHSISNMVFGGGLRNTYQLIVRDSVQTPHSDNDWPTPPHSTPQTKWLHTVPHYAKKAFQKTGIELDDKS